jgi:hypothetical protein
MWLIKKLHPDFKTIADFLKENKKQIRDILKKFNTLCREWDLIGTKMGAVDGSTLRASNSKKNNYNKKKIDRQLKYIEEKISTYLSALDGDDDDGSDLKVKFSIEELEEKIEALRAREGFYKDLENQLEKSGESEISTTDPDARLMDNKRNGLDVSYNVQIAADEKNKLVVAVDVTNKPSDQGHLNDMAQAAKEGMGLDEKSEIEILADKGYYQADDLIKCEENGTTTYVTHQVYANSTGNPEYYPAKFKYNEEEDVYICPEGHKLHRIKHKKDAPVQIKYRNYEACAKCPNKDKCTKAEKGRIISRSKHQDFLDIVDARTMDNMDKYAKRQMIIEHPFGTVKRSMGATYFLRRGLESVKAEAALIFLAYNMKRAINILGVAGILERLGVECSSFLLFLTNLSWRHILQG